jgi:hypothetical protein
LSILKAQISSKDIWAFNMLKQLFLLGHHMGSNWDVKWFVFEKHY